MIGSNLPVPPPNIGPRSNPSYDPPMGVASLGGNRKVFAGPRDDPFFVDLGSIFDLAGLRQFNGLHSDPARNRGGRGRREELQHTLDRTAGAEDRPAAACHGERDDRRSTRVPRGRRSAILREDGSVDANGKWIQVSRLGNPLVNEVIIPLGKKDRWNASDPANDSQFLQHYTAPSSPFRANALYAALMGDFLTNRSDLVAVLLTGVPGSTSRARSRLTCLRLNTAIPPAGEPEPAGRARR